MIWLIFTILAIFSRAIYSITVKMFGSNIKLSPVTQSVMLTFVAGCLAVILSPLFGGLSFRGVAENLPLIVIMALTQAFGNILYFKGQNILEASITQIAYSSVLIWGSMLSFLFLGSRFSPLQLLGIGLLLFAIVFVQYQKGERKINKGVLYLVLSALFFAGFQVASAGLADNLTTATYLVFAYLGAAFLTFILYHRRVTHDLKKSRGKYLGYGKFSIMASVPSLLYFSFAYFAYREAPDAGVVVVLLTSQVILSILLGIWLLKERQNISKKVTAGVMAFAAAALIKS